MFEYFYNEIFRSVIIAFGSIFNGIEVKKSSSIIKVPLAYGPTQKFLARMQQEADLNKPDSITLPRMAFELLGLQLVVLLELLQLLVVVLGILHIQHSLLVLQEHLQELVAHQHMVLVILTLLVLDILLNQLLHLKHLLVLEWV